jgi:hemolysin activation/secretion protein
VVEGPNPLSEGKTADLLAPLTGRKHTLDSLREAAKVLEDAIRAKGYAFHRVALPPQTLREGQVALRVIDFRVDRIEVIGNRRFDRDNVLAGLPELQEGVSPNNETLGNQLKVANQHPAKKLNLKLRQSEKPEHIDALVNVEEEDPLQVYLMFNTRGTEQTGGYRLTGGLQHSNLWNLDHSAAFSYTTSPDHADAVSQWGFSYALPVYAVGGWLSAYYAQSDARTGAVAEGITLSGAGEMMGAHYTQHLPRFDLYSHSLDLGLDDKHFINDIEVSGTDFGPDVRSRPFSLTYRGDYTQTWFKTGFYLSWSRNLGGGSDNTEKEYAQSRFGASDEWDVLRYGVFADLQLPAQWALRLNLSGQGSWEPLIAGEQLGLGGVYSVRGYQEREVIGDNGQVFHGELWSPQWLPDLNFLIFYDHGFADLIDPQPGDTDNQMLRSTGLGARWHWGTYVDLAVDYAHAFDKSPQTAQGDNMLHYTLICRF